MLEIISNNVSLDLPDDIQINFIIENPLMQSDRIPVPFTLDFDLDPSPKNLKEFDFPSRVTSFRKKEFPVIIRFEGINITSGLLKLKSYDKTLKVNFKGVSVFDELTTKLYDVEMEKYDFGVATQVKNGKGKWGINRNDPYNFAGRYRKLHNETDTNTKFVLAPIRTSEDDWTRINKEVILTFIGATVKVNVNLVMPTNSADNEYINFYNFRDFEFNITSNYNITKLPEFYSSPIYNTRAFPLPYLGYIFDVCFKNSLVENPFAQGELSKLVLVHPYHPNYKRITGFFEDDEFEGMLFDNSANQSGSFAPFYKLNSFMPNMSANEFLKEILKLFCSSLFPEGDKFKIIRNEDVLANQTTEDWSLMLIDELKFELQSGQAYKYGYEEIEETPISVPSENVLQTIKDLIDVNVGPESNYIADFKVQSTGEYYTKEVSSTGATYKRLNSGYGKSAETSNEAYDTSSLITPLPMGIYDYWIEKHPDPQIVPNTGKAYVPTYSGDRMNRQTKANIMFYRGLKPGFVAGRKYPLLTAGNYDGFGNKIGDYSLAWEGEDGLLNKFHKSHKEWIEREKLRASGEFRLTPMDFKMLDLSIRKYINGRRFFVEKLNVTFTKTTIQPAVIDFLED